MDTDYDVIVIGAGPGGQVAAIRAAQLELKTACIDDGTSGNGRAAPGGTCTNVGCIPTKALLHSTMQLETVKHHVAAHGIEVGEVKVDLARMQARRAAVVRQNNEGILYLFRKNAIRFVHGRARIAGRVSGGFAVEVSSAEPMRLTARHLILATGSKSRVLPLAPFDEERVLSSDAALSLGQVPARLGIVGAGVVGLELGSVWRRLGSEVCLLETSPSLLPAADGQIAREAQRVLGRQGLDFRLGLRLESVERRGDAVEVGWTGPDGTAAKQRFDRLIVAIGRVPQLEGLGSETLGLARDERGGLQVDEFGRTSVPGVWAIGDVVRGPMLAHKAEDEGMAVAERIAGQLPEHGFERVPWVIYTEPEIAWVGLTEEQLQAEGRRYRAGSFPLSANGRARSMGNTLGFVKILADVRTDRILGMHAIGPMASELIAEGVLAMEFGGTSEDIARTCHAHPTLTEATKEAALAVRRRAINI